MNGRIVALYRHPLVRCLVQALVVRLAAVAPASAATIVTGRSREYQTACGKHASALLFISVVFRMYHG